MLDQKHWLSFRSDSLLFCYFTDRVCRHGLSSSVFFLARFFAFLRSSLPQNPFTISESWKAGSRVVGLLRGPLKKHWDKTFNFSRLRGRSPHDATNKNPRIYHGDTHFEKKNKRTVATSDYYLLFGVAIVSKSLCNERRSSPLGNRIQNNYFCPRRLFDTFSSNTNGQFRNVIQFAFFRGFSILCAKNQCLFSPSFAIYPIFGTYILDANKDTAIRVTIRLPKWFFSIFRKSTWRRWRCPNSFLRSRWK